jgi:ferritin
MYLWLQDKGYTGAAKLWKRYSEEEMKHASWAEDFLDSFNIKPAIRPLEEPPCEFEGLGDIIRRTLEHETNITNECNELARICLSEINMSAFSLAMKYVAEQVEEMDKSYFLYNRLQLFGEDPVSLRIFDNELGELA